MEGRTESKSEALQRSDNPDAKRAAAHVADHLREGWKLRNVAELSRGDIMRDDGALIILRTEQKTREIRIRVSAILDVRSKAGEDASRFLPYNTRWPHITLAADTPPEAIAKAITRRLLPKFEPVAAAILEKIKATDESENRVGIMADKLCDIAGIGEERSCRYAFSGYVNGQYIRAEVFDDTTKTKGSIHLELRHLTFDQACQVLEIVKDPA